MTRILLLFLLALSLSAHAQTPQGINYQAVAHDNTGATLNNQTISVRIGIISSSISGPLEWEETHNVTTNSYGLFDLVIGQGTSTGTGNQTAFANIDWANASHFMKVEVDPGTGYENLGTSQLLAVPYALHARTVENDQVDDADADATNELITGGTLNGTDLEITDAGGTTTVDLSPLSGTGDDWGTQVAVTDATMSGDGTAGTPLTVVGDLTDDQTLSYNSGLQTLDISGGNQVTLVVDDADADATNELLTGGTMNGTDLELTDAGGITTIDMSSLVTSDTLPIIKNAGNNTYVSTVSNTEIEMGFGGAAHYIFDDQGRLTLFPTTGNLFIADSPGGTALTTGTNNLAFGNSSLAAVTSGYFNVALGLQAMPSVTTAAEMIAIGRGALLNATTGNNDIAIGTHSLEEMIGDTNIGIGRYAGDEVQGGYQNIFIGLNAGSQTSPAPFQIGSIKIGTHAGFDDPTNNKLYIGHGPAKTLIYGNLDNDSLKVFGSLSVAEEYTFPLTDGVSGQILETDGAGQVSWVTPSAASIDEIVDADNDTKIQVEEGPDDDEIRFDIAGSELMRLDNQTLHLYDGTSNTFVGWNTGVSNNNASGLENSAFGFAALTSNTTGFSNTAIGNLSMQNNTTGILNTAIGSSSLRSNIGGVSNTSVGRNSLRDIANGSNNVALGEAAGVLLTSGDQNTFIGTAAGHSKTSGANNVFLGTNAGHNNTVGAGNVFLGYSSGSNETGSDKLFIENSNSSTPLIYGNFASDSVKIYGSLSIGDEYTLPLIDATTANHVMASDAAGTLTWVDPATLLGFPGVLSDSDNDTRIEVEQTTDEDVIRFSLGDATGYPAQEYFRMVGHRFEPINPSFSVFVGEQAGANDDMTSNQGVFVGYFAGNSNTSGQSNVGIGMLALSSNTIGSANTAVGGNTLGANISGTGNTAIGFSSQQASTGDQNTSVGNGSLDANTTGYENTAVGSFALMSNTTGFYNVGIGRLSFTNAVASNNTGLGYSSGSSTTTGISNTFLGYRAGIGNTSGGFNVVIGSAAGDNSTTGSNNILIGYNAETSTGNLSNATAIGANAQVAQNNSVVIGSINGVNGASADANVGIGTTAPQSRLHVVTDGNLLGGLRIEDQSSTTVGASIHFDAFSQDWDIYASNSGATAGGNKFIIRDYTNAADRFVINNAGNTGIGTTNPSATLDVVGTLQYADGSQSDGAVLTSDGTGNATWKPSRVAFYEGQSLSATQQTIPQGVQTRLQFTGGGNSLTFNDGGGYNAATYEFIAPVAGVYQFNVNTVFAGGTNQTCNIIIMSDIQGRVSEETGVFNPDAANWYSANMSVTVRLAANERISVDFIKLSGGNSSLYQDKSSFSGHLIYAD